MAKPKPVRLKNGRQTTVVKPSDRKTSTHRHYHPGGRGVEAGYYPVEIGSWAFHEEVTSSNSRCSSDVAVSGSESGYGTATSTSVGWGGNSNDGGYSGGGGSYGGGSNDGGGYGGGGGGGGSSCGGGGGGGGE